MEETTEKPIAYGAIEGMQPYKDIEKQLEKVRFEEVRGRVSDYKDDLMKKDPLEAAKIEAVYNLLFGIFLSPDQKRELTFAQKAASARLQHNLVHHVYYATRNEASDEFVRGIHRIVFVSDRLANVRGNEASRPLTFWSGVMSELAVVKTLTEHDWHVYLPDYTRNDGNIYEDEVVQFDVKSGVDLIAIADDTTYLIDAKGRGGTESISVEGEVVSLNEQNFLLRKKLAELYEELNGRGEQKIVKATVVIPTAGLTRQRSGGSLNRLGEFALPSDFRDEMGKFCSLDDGMKESILSGLTSLAERTKNKELVYA